MPDTDSDEEKPDQDKENQIPADEVKPHLAKRAQWEMQGYTSPRKTKQVSD